MAHLIIPRGIIPEVDNWTQWTPWDDGSHRWDDDFVATSFTVMTYDIYDPTHFYLVTVKNIYNHFTKYFTLNDL